MIDPHSAPVASEMEIIPVLPFGGVECGCLPGKLDLNVGYLANSARA